jgi:C_GCAxxG_C_C family probable redox protein
MTARQQKAVDLFVKGYTCSQAVLLAFSDLTGLDETTAGKLSSVFGGGMGGMRSTCGAVTGMFMAAGLLYGFPIPCDNQEKTLCYSRIRTLASRFEEKHGTLVCKELLASLPGKLSENPSPRNQEYYKIRPCALLVEDAVGILEDYIKENAVK